jgi:hypothetical protein
MNMQTIIRSLVILVGLFAAQFAQSQAPAGAPAGATGMCKDGTYSTAASKQGACRGHQGVKEWYTASSASGKNAAGSAPNTQAPATAPQAPASSAAAPAAAPAQTAPTPKSQASSKTPAPGGGPGQVWLNTSTNVYHCPGTKYYGTTKAGAYMTEAEAKAKGARPDHGKACQ